MTAITLNLDGRLVSTSGEATLLEVATENGILLPTLCHLDGLEEVGSCRLCLVHVGKRLLPACCTKATEGMEVRTQSEELSVYRRMIVELLMAERNHICSVCVVNGHCELQDLAASLGVDHVRFDYLSPQWSVDLTHERFGLDHNRCILCTRCVRVCDAIEGAHTWDIAGRGTHSWVTADLNVPWGEAISCTSCGKCVQACPVGALFRQGSSVGSMEHDRNGLIRLIAAREKREWSE